uniref:Uncharacterized protein n=1 Tax=Rhizophora mucronata TaxID=61149 RepID=A0A2P2PDI6_RHIMU
MIHLSPHSSLYLQGSLILIMCY